MKRHHRKAYRETIAWAKAHPLAAILTHALAAAIPVIVLRLLK